MTKPPGESEHPHDSARSEEPPTLGVRSRQASEAAHALEFRLNHLEPRQLRAVLRQVGAGHLEDLSARERIRLESFLGVLIARYRRADPSARLSPRLLRKMLRTPEKLFRGHSQHRSLAQEVYATRVATELPSVVAPRAAASQGPAQLMSFRLADLSDEQRDALASALRRRLGKLDELAGTERIELEATLAVYLDAWTNGRSLQPRYSRLRGERVTVAQVPPSVLVRMVRRPGSVFRHERHLRQRIADLALERSLSELKPAPGSESQATPRGVDLEPAPKRSTSPASDDGGLGPLRSNQPDPSVLAKQAKSGMLDVDPRQLIAGQFRFAMLSTRQLRVVERWMLNRGRTELPPSEVIEVEAWLGVAIEKVTGGLLAERVPPRRLRAILSSPRRVFGHVSRVQYLADLVALERKRAVRDGQELAPGVHVASVFARATSPRFVARGLGSAVTDAGSAWSSWQARLQRSRWAAAIHGLGERIDLLFGRTRAGALLSALVGYVAFAYVHSLLFGQPARASWFSGPGPVFWSWLANERAAIPIAVLLFASLLAVGAPWRAFADSPAVRPVALALVTVLALWVLAMPPNLSFGRTFWVDRLLVVLFATLSFRHPFALPLFLTEVLLLAQQTRFPALTASRVMSAGFLKEPVVDLLIAFLMFAVLRLPRWRFVDGRVFLMIAVATTAVSYYRSALSLILLGPRPWTWARHEELGNAWVAAWQQGWQGSIPEALVVRIGEALNAVSPAFNVPLLMLSLATVVALLSRRIAAVVFLSLAVAHVAQFLVSGVFAWGWFLAAGLLSLLFFAARTDGERATGLVPGLVMALAVLFLPRAGHRFEPPAFHTRLLNVVHLEVVDSEGVVRELSPIWLAPYDKVLPLQIGVLSGGVVGGRGTTESASLTARLESFAARSRGGYSELQHLAGGALAGQVTTLEPFDELVRNVVRSGGRGAAATWRRLPVRAVNAGTVAVPLPLRNWREARLRRDVTFWTRSGIEILSSDVVHRFPLSRSSPGDEAREVAGGLPVELLPAEARLRQQLLERRPLSDRASEVRP